MDQPRMTMEPGTVIAERFVVEHRRGVGGMGAVYRAHDKTTGSAVAVKLIHDESGAEYFAREASLLAKLRHPGIVRYVAHGRTTAGSAYLAMEWLDGIDLETRLRTGALSSAETVALARRVAEALGAAHAAGVVHRDVKPSNLFLEDGQVDRVKILDFGIARRLGAARLTGKGVVLGTPGYMAPEQARGLVDGDARIDVFGLGCVVFECLTGIQPFAAETVVAVLAKVLLEDTPHVADRVPGVSTAIDQLVARMMAKESSERPPDGSAVARDLADLQVLDQGSSPRPVSRATSLTDGERRLLSVLLLSGVTAPSGAGARHRASQDNDLAPLREAARAFGAQVDPLADGSVVATLAGGGAATDRASLAARLALALRAAAPRAPMALATGRGILAGRSPVGEVIDAASRLLDTPGSHASARTQRGIFRTPGRPTKTPSPLWLQEAPLADLPPIRIDEVTAGLLDSRFDVGGDRAGLVLRGERELVHAPRTLLGRPTPIVGRDAELTTLTAVLESCKTEPCARMVLVTAPAGIGKSRLIFEFLGSLQAAGATEILLSRCDPMRSGAPLGALAPIVRRAAGIDGHDSLSVKRRKLWARVGRHMAAKDVDRVAPFLGELASVSFPDQDNVQLRAARRDAQLMGDQVRRAWEDWLAAECMERPVLIVLDDLHWGDLPSIQLIEAALRRLEERPLMVVALARPEVRDLFPDFFSDRDLTEIRLAPFSRRAAEKLITSILPASIGEARVARLVSQAAGNAFYLEELIRAVAEGREGTLPPTVLAMIQARLEELEDESRRALRAAAIFGQEFSVGAVAALLGKISAEDLAQRFDDLERRELLSRRSRLEAHAGPFGTGYAFRHPLIREAAYAMLTETDRALGHHMAADWLVAAGESEAIVLAEHFERGGERRRAAEFYGRAAEQALEANDFAAVVTRAQRGIDCGAVDEAKGRLWLLAASAEALRGEFLEAVRHGGEALRCLPSRSAGWLAAAAEVAAAKAKLGDHTELPLLAEEFLSSSDDALDDRRAIAATIRLAIHLFHSGRFDLGGRLAERVERIAPARIADDPGLAARIHRLRATHALFDGDVGRNLAFQQEAVTAFEQSGDLLNACIERGNLGAAYLQMGAYERAEEALDAALGTAERIDASYVWAFVRQAQGLTLARLGRRIDGELAIEEAIDAFVVSGDRRMEGASRIYYAMILVENGDAERGEAEATTAAQLFPEGSPNRATALAVLAEAHLVGGAAAKALAPATEAMQILEELGALEEGESMVRLAYVHALAASHRDTEARKALAQARSSLQVRADRIKEGSLRDTFLGAVPENARILALAREWLGTTG